MSVPFPWDLGLVKCIWKVFAVLHFFHILLCYSLIPKWIKFLIFLKLTMTTWTKFVWNVCKFIKYKKWRNHMYISIHSLCSILRSTVGTNYSLKSFWVWC